MNFEELKARLDIVDVVAQDYELKRSGRQFEAREHDSLKVDPERQRFTWYSRDIRGDVLDWLSLRRFGRLCEPGAGEEFHQVLRDACELAGVDYEQTFGGSADAREKADDRRRRYDVLAQWHQVAVKHTTGEKRLQAQGRKPILTPEVQRRWGIVDALSMATMQAAGLDLDELKLAGLVSEGQNGDYPLFRDAFIVPFYERGSIRYFTSRRYRDDNMFDNQPLRGPKSLHLPGPRKAGDVWRGVPKPDAFNRDAIHSPEAREHGLLIVEGPLDAIACCERGHPAIALLGKTVSEGLQKRLRRASEVTPYLALDGTDDVNAAERVRVAAAIGYLCMVITLPPGKDPDDMEGEELRTLKADAVPVLKLALELVDAEEDTSRRLRLLQMLAKIAAKWLTETPAIAGEVRQQVCEVLGFMPTEYDRWLRSEGASVPQDDPAAVDFFFNGQPPALPFGWDSVEDPAKRPQLKNLVFQERTKKVRRDDPNTGKQIEVEEVQNVPIATTPQDVVQQVQQRMDGALCRLAGEGSRSTTLFLETLKQVPDTPDLPAYPRPVDDDALAAQDQFAVSKLLWLEGAQPLNTLLHRGFRQQFRRGTDFEGTNFLAVADLFHALGTLPDVPEYKAVEVRPHWPVIPEHYYMQSSRGPDGYTATGEYLLRLLQFFQNFETDVDRLLALTAFLTPGWGGTGALRYGCRPMFVFNAADQGSGKTTLAQAIGDLWGGYLPLELTRRGEEEFTQRALSPGGQLTRVVLIDNVRTTLASAYMEALLTARVIRGKQLYRGDASRPNDLVTLVTLNNARCSRDMSERAMFIHMEKPVKTATWAKEVAAYTSAYGRFIVADLISILQQPKPAGAHELQDRWPVWAEEVLSRACASPAAQQLFGRALDPREVLALNQERRDATDQDQEQAAEFWDGVLDRCCRKWTFDADGEGLVQDFRWELVPDPIHVPSEDHKSRSNPFGMAQWAQEIFNRRELNSAWVKQFIEGHHNAGRLPHISYTKRPQRGYRVSAAPVVAELKRRAKAQEESEASQYAAD
jgi:DNA primase